MEEKEMINQPGLVSVEKELFTPEAIEESEDVQPEAPVEPATVVDQVQPVAQEVVEPEKTQSVEPEKAPAQPVQPTRLLADKFKTEEDLKHAFINLGGNPNRYSSTEKLEEAYEVRQQEFTRSRQELQIQERLNKNISTPKQSDNPLDPEALLDKVQWDNVTDARSLGRELIGLMSNLVPKNEPNLPSEAELVERIMPIMKEREARTQELNQIESDVPRLKLVEGQENPFRDAFARHVFGEKNSGSFISLKKSMESFLNWGKEIAAEANSQAGIQRDNKLDASPIADRGAGLPTGGQADEIDSIIGSYKARKDKLGEF